MLTRSVVAVCATVLISVAPAAASTILLDFQTAATGLNIVGTPLVTSEGTITASATAGTATFAVLSGILGLPTNALTHSQADDASYGQLAFSFDVASIEFLYSGHGGGVFNGQALDAGLNVIASFFDPDTTLDQPGGPVTISAPGIRFFRFSDRPAGAVTVAIDDVILTTVDAPEPATILLLASGLAGAFARRRARRA